MKPRKTPKGTQIQFDTTMQVDVTLNDVTDLTPHVLSVMHEPGIDKPISEREWLMLAVACLQAADRARQTGDFHNERRFTALACKCDRETVPTSVVSPSSYKEH